MRGRTIYTSSQARYHVVVDGLGVTCYTRFRWVARLEAALRGLDGERATIIENTEEGQGA